VQISYVNFQSLTYELIALSQSRHVVTGLAAHTAARRSSASAVANGYQCKQWQINCFRGCLKLPETKFILITALYGNYIQVKN